jgi:hypothetical protein
MSKTSKTKAPATGDDLLDALADLVREMQGSLPNRAARDAAARFLAAHARLSGERRSPPPPPQPAQNGAADEAGDPNATKATE